MGNGITDKRKEILRWVKENRDEIPNLGNLYSKLADEGSDGHYVHAYYVYKLHNCGRYKITDIEATTDDGHDVDIQLDGRINIQVWHGMNTAGHILASLLEPDTAKSKGIGKHLGAPADQGGVPTDPERDEKKMRAKLAQLPDDALGILLLHSGPFHYYNYIPNEDMPAGKCVIKVVPATSMAELHYSPEFDRLEEVKGVLSCLRIGLVDA